jgi:hypothetical protein
VAGIEIRACAETGAGSGAVPADRSTAQVLAMYIAVVCTSMLCIGIGSMYIADLKNKIYIFGPAFLIIVLVMFYGIVTTPRQFSPTRIPRYARRPPAVEELARLLRSSGTGPAGERLHRAFRNALCQKLDMPGESANAEILAAVTRKYPHLAENVETALDRCEFFTDGKKKIMTEKEFIENYTFLIKLLYSFDGRLWK